jgi:hypothetical protein
MAMKGLASSGLITFLFLGIVSNVWSQGKPATDREQILEVERKFTDTVVSNNVKELEEILADDYLGTEPDGKLVTKADSIAEAKSGPSEFASCRLNENEVKVRFYDHVAVVNGTEDWRRKDGGIGRFIWTDIMVKQHDHWQVVASQDLSVAMGK